MTTTLDLRRELRGLYSAAPEPALVDVPDLAFLMIDGHGDPNSAPAYPSAVQALYSVAYAVRFALERGRPPSTRGSCRWKGCGGPTTWPPSPPTTSPTGTGRS
ncbi:hypothetical protein [Blastococcus brunescens]|uniref:Uncharacterized protein n=1 Tax=Blastococcus brunescens TaxID=1564165 RepID=A0ABZ1B991_9ACTN|nr:hypothetical protein [Blastococcus sp. BMG 8361]WRL67374.1 hypothetical protein U6N30_12725 [Blastococcus sp. BMG 8361]